MTIIGRRSMGEPARVLGGARRRPGTGDDRRAEQGNGKPQPAEVGLPPSIVGMRSQLRRQEAKLEELELRIARLEKKI